MIRNKKNQNKIKNTQTAKVIVHSVQGMRIFTGRVTLLHMLDILKHSARLIASHCSGSMVGGFSSVIFNPKLKIKAFLPSSSSLASSSAFLSLSCIITRLATEAKVRFIGLVVEVAGAVVGAAVEEEEGESVGVLQAMLLDAEEADESLEEDETLGI